MNKRHQFEKNHVQPGHSVIERCECGLVSKRFASGIRHYQQADGVFKQGEAPTCTLDGQRESILRVKPEVQAMRKAASKALANGEPLRSPPDMTKEQQDAQVARVKKLTEPHEARYQARQTLKTTQERPDLMSEAEARLKDAYILINVLFEEIVTAGMRTPGRQMAGRLLYSAGYAEIVKNLEK